jgi:O-antigen/teichoic acid export membrane protein
MMKDAGQNVVYKMLTGTTNIFLANLLVLPIGFITTVFLARLLDPANFGLFAITARIIVWIEWTTTALFAGATVKFVSEQENWKSVCATVLHVHLVIGFGVAALLWLFSPKIASMFNEPSLTAYIRLFALDIPVFGLTCAIRSILTGRGNFNERAKVTLIYWIVRLILIALFVGIGLSVEGAIFGSIGASIVTLIVCTRYVPLSLYRRPAFPLRRLSNFAVPLFMSAFSARLFRLDLLVYKALGGSAANAGFYGAAQNLSLPVSMLGNSVAPPFLSTLSTLISKGKETEAKDLASVVMRGIFLIIPFAALVAGSASEIIELVYGSKFFPSGPILGFLVFAALGLFYISVATAILTALGRPWLTFFLVGPMIPIALVGYLFFVPTRGPVGAAMVTAVTACMGAFASFLTIYIISRLYPPLRTILNSLICAVFTFSMAKLWPACGIMLVSKLLVIAIVTATGYILLGELGNRELTFFREALCRRLGWSKKEGNVQ